MNAEIDINQELLLEFIDESLEGLSNAESLFLRLENEPENMELINTIFRPVHSMKGNAAYFGLMDVKQLSHKMENLLDALRKNKLKVTKAVINALLPGIDLLKKMLEKARNNEDRTVFAAESSEIIKNIDAVQNAPQDSNLFYKEKLKEISLIANSLNLELLSAELREKINKIKEIVSGIEFEKSEIVQKSLPDKSEKNEIELLKDLLKTPFNEKADNFQIEKIENLLDLIKNISKTQKFQASYEELRGIFIVFKNAGIDIDNVARELMLERLINLENVLLEEKSQPNEVSAAEKKEVLDTALQNKQAEKTMRIAQSSLDGFLDKVGELLEIEEIFRYQIRNIGAETDFSEFASRFKQSVAQLSQVSHSLLNSVMEIRKVESGTLLRKVPRIIRDVADASGKKINVKIIGDEIPVDKSYIDLLDAPLTHIARNAADHGIETPEKRRLAGKKEEGLVVVELVSNDEHIKLIVSDDGAGLNYEALKKKAIELGIISTDRNLSEDEVVNLLFMSGVSTAEKVTDISGRGVGMDVVKRSVESAGGEISVKSETGKGTVFTITLPATVNTKIVEGCIVETYNKNKFIIPMKIVEESFPEFYKNICYSAGGGKSLKRRGTVYNAASLDELLGFKNIKKDKKMGSFILLRNGNKKFVVEVDAVIGVQKIVTKPLIGISKTKKQFEGAAILGDGTVGLIVNSEWIMSFTD